MKEVSIVFILTIAIMAAVVWIDSLLPFANPFYQPAQAASAAPTPISENCVEVASVGLLDVFFCETDYGDLYVNSFGFMVSAD